MFLLFLLIFLVFLVFLVFRIFFFLPFLVFLRLLAGVITALLIRFVLCRSVVLIIRSGVIGFDFENQIPLLNRIPLRDLDRHHLASQR